MPASLGLLLEVGSTELHLSMRGHGDVQLPYRLQWFHVTAIPLAPSQGQGSSGWAFQVLPFPMQYNRSTHGVQLHKKLTVQ